MRKTRALLAAAVVALTLTGGLAAASRNDSADAAIGPITWQDEFNGAANSPIDGNKWKFDIGGSGWGNNEQQYYTNSTSNVRHDGQGHLAITARKENPANYQCHYGTCQYTSGRILTADKFSQTYGRFEASIKVPRGQGIWPAFWMLGGNNWPTTGEIDIMEHVGKDPTTVYGTVHGPGYSGAEGVGGNRNLGVPLSDAFHTYAVEWSPNLIVWFVDGSEYFRVTPASLGGDQWVFDHSFFMILNLAVGGYWPGYPDGTTPASRRGPTAAAAPRRRPPPAAPRSGRTSATAASTSPAAPRPTAPGCSSGTATAAARRSGRRTATAPCVAWASAWTRRGAR
jgi:beta-glucanase (GH16 family)